MDCLSLIKPADKAFATRTDKTFTTCWSGSKVQVWVHIWALASHLAITLKGYSRAKSTAKLLGQHAGTASEGRAGKYKQVSCCCWWQQTAYLKKKCCCSATLSSWRVELFWCRLNCGLWQVTDNRFFFLCEMMMSMDFVKTHFKWKPCSLLRSFFWSFIGRWVKSRHRNKSTCCKSSPVQTTLQSSRSE